MIDPGLLASVRADIASAKENGYDWLGTHPATHPMAHATDLEIAEDLQACTSGYESYEPEDLANVVAAVRKERA